MGIKTKTLQYKCIYIKLFFKKFWASCCSSPKPEAKVVFGPFLPNIEEGLQLWHPRKPAAAPFLQAPSIKFPPAASFSAGVIEPTTSLESPLDPVTGILLVVFVWHEDGGPPSTIPSFSENLFSQMLLLLGVTIPSLLSYAASSNIYDWNNKF